MISSTTLLLATLVFNAAVGFGAPIRIPTVPDVVARAVVDNPILPRVEVVDVQPVRKRSVEGNANRPRLAREIAPEVDTRDTASSESVSVRDSLPEIEEIVRRFPRRALYDRHIAKRSPEPIPTPPSDPAVETRSTAPEPIRRFARRALFERHAQRSEPTPPEARSEDPDPHFTRRDNPELFEKRSAPTTDNFPREPEPAPAPEPVPEPAPVPQSPPEPEVKAREPEPERRRAYPRRVLAERYEKREEDPPAEADPPASTAPAEATPSPVTPTPSAPTPSPTVSASGLPPNLDFNKVIADAIVSGTTNTVKHSQGQKVADWRDTKITIQITQQQNSDVKLEPIANPASPPTSTSVPLPTPTGSSPTGTSSPSPSPSPTGTGSSSPPEGSGSGSPTDSTTPKEDGATTDDPVNKPAVPTEKPADAADGNADSSGSPDDGKTADPADKRDLDNANAAAEPVTKRQLGLAGSLLASWTRRNV